MHKQYEVVENMIQKFIESITRGPFYCWKKYDGEFDSDFVRNHNANYKDIYGIAVYQAYLDACRTMPGVGEGKKKKDLETSLESMAVGLKKYFEGKAKKTDAVFDRWHHLVCEDFERKTKCTIGQSQKILNMAFKYLYCCSDIRGNKNEHFLKCHMPLDGYTLKWYKDICKKSPYKEYACKIGDWSKINDIELYESVQKNIRLILKDDNVLMREFEIWQEEKDRVERKGLIVCAEKIINSGKIEDELKRRLETFKEDMK